MAEDPQDEVVSPSFGFRCNSRSSLIKASIRGEGRKMGREMGREGRRETDLGTSVVCCWRMRVTYLGPRIWFSAIDASEA